MRVQFLAAAALPEMRKSRHKARAYHLVQRVNGIVSLRDHGRIQSILTEPAPSAAAARITHKVSIFVKDNSAKETAAMAMVNHPVRESCPIGMLADSSNPAAESRMARMALRSRGCDAR